MAVKNMGRLNAQLEAAVRDSDSLLRIDAVIALTGLGRSSIYAKVASGEFPKPITIGKRCSRFPAGSVRIWLQLQAA